MSDILNIIAMTDRDTIPIGCRRLGLIGNPIGHSRSPVLFREYFADRPDILQRWSYDLIQRDNFSDAYSVFLRGYVAVNVTAPFKEDAFRAADSYDYSALRCMAANLLVKIPVDGICSVARQVGDGTVPSAGRGQRVEDTIPFSDSAFQIMAYNTDFEAVQEIIRQEYSDSEGYKALVIGCGGAGKAAAAAALEAGMQTTVCNRTIGRSLEYVEHLRTCDPHSCSAVPQIVGLDSVEINSEDRTVPGRFPLPAVMRPAADELLAAIRDSDVIIYSLPGPVTTIRHLLTVCPDILSGKTVIEANYKDPFLNTVPCRRYISGLTWLRLQAVATYRIVLGPSLLSGTHGCSSI